MYSPAMSLANQLREAVSGTQAKNQKRMYSDDELSAQLDLAQMSIERGAKFWNDPSRREGGKAIVADLRKKFDLPA